MGSFILLIFILSACSSQEDKVLTAAIEHLETTYHLEDIEGVSVEYNPLPIAFIVHALDYLFNGKDYDVVLQVNEPIPIDVEGVVNGRKLEFKNNNYVSSKHETFQKENEAYKQMMEQLEEFGLGEMVVCDRYFDGAKRTVHFRLAFENVEISSDQLIHQLNIISEMMLENIDTNISMQLNVNASDLLGDRLRSEWIEIEIAPYDEKEYGNLVKILEDQFAAIQSANRIDQELIDDLEKFRFSIVSSRLNDIDQKKRGKADNDLIRHELKMNVLKGYELENLLAGIQLLQEKGFDQTFLQLSFQEGSTTFCQVGKIRTVEDIEHCYTDITQSAIVK